MFLKFISIYHYYNFWVQKQQGFQTICNLFNIYIYFFVFTCFLKFFFYKGLLPTSFAFLNCIVKNVFIYQQIRRKFSLLRSPFIYKLSWDQLEYQVYKLTQITFLKFRSYYAPYFGLLHQFYFKKYSLQKSQQVVPLKFMIALAKKG